MLRTHQTRTLAASLVLLAACGGTDEGQVSDTGGVDAPDTNNILDVPLIDVPQTTSQQDSSQPVDTAPDGEIAEGAFGAPCQSNVNCIDGFCVEGPEGLVCTRTCVEDCPTDYDCRGVTTSGADTVFLCMPRVARVCIPCKTDFQCPGGACLQIEGDGQCAALCEEDDDCPNGYTCKVDAENTHEDKYCQPTSGSCQCTPDVDGSLRTCFATNAIGTCYGVETCTDGGWVDCTAKTPAEEICNGLDDDCNLLVDDGLLDNVPCDKTVEGVGTCHGRQLCAGASGFICTAATPEPEVCDFRDNDCDDEIDEDFKDENGEFTLTANCGTCGNDCTNRIPNGTGECSVENGAAAVCVVAECDPDYIAINRFQCSLPPDTSCQPCDADDDCYGGSCISLDGQSVCVTPCGAAANACNPGYSCDDIGGGVERCVPVTASCVCNATTDGALRTCNVTNSAGTCFGVESCDSDSGWTNCNARTPTAETCNGQDDDCNGRADDGVTPPVEACQKTVAGVGTCAGQWFCTDPDGAGNQGVAWFCNASTPTAEVCDFLDNDCSGTADDAFKNAGGLYVDNDNCGSCGISCDNAIPNATATCHVNGSIARCEVESCAPGYYKAGPVTCVAVSDDLCAPCATDANCPTPGDKCLNLDGANACGRDCSATNLHGTPEDQCPTGFVCEAQAGGGKQCVPQSHSCSCLAGDGGDTRTCFETNPVGTCYGQETCNPVSGWSTCTARVPATEVCNDLDDNCNSAIDDVAGRGGACQNTNGFGSCDGVLDCTGSGSDLACSGQTPSAEVCDYLDNDCDGTTDEGFGNLFDSCSNGLGQCTRYGFYECNVAGNATFCNADAADPETELCNNLDDDCDGQTDEEAAWAQKGQACTVGNGICQATGVRVCTANGQSLQCSATPGNPAPNDLCNGLDDNCNGQTDESFPQKGEVCSAGNGACQAFGTRVCTGDGTALTCSATQGNPTNEACDLIDNDCDSVTDEDFKTGSKYTATTACGNCFTNCTTIFAKPNAFGTCNTAPAVPQCQMSCNPNFYDLNGVPDDGCEFQLEASAIYVSQSDASAIDNAGCGLGPSTTGGGRYPCKTIAQGLTRAQGTAGKTKVVVAGGAYVENVTVRDGISLFGGYNPQNWTRDIAANLTAIFSAQTSGHRKTVVADGIVNADTTIDGFNIYGQSATGLAENSYAVWVRNSNQRLRITNNIIWGGSGGPGNAGTRGGDGANGGNGGAGIGAREGNNMCPYDANGNVLNPNGCAAFTISNAPGSAGTNGSCANANGGAGGGATCPDYSESVSLCTATTSYPFNQVNNAGGTAGSGTGAGAAGIGGCDSLIDPFLTECDCQLPQAGGGCTLGAYSSAGGNGATGTKGGAGTATANNAGSVNGAEWQGAAGTGGGSGSAGAGGGGGGAGGGVETWSNAAGTSCVAYNDGTTTVYSRFSDVGGSGGGGGAGGCGGTGGTTGGPGGGAFSIFVVFATAPTTATIPTISGNSLHRGFGGTGGRGGDGGTAGSGGAGGAGGAGGTPASQFWCATPGSKGGEGGDGGPGGGGAGGAGGVAYGLFASGQGSASLAAWISGNSYVSDGGAGPSGAGGGVGAGGNAGQPGPAGAISARNF